MTSSCSVDYESQTKPCRDLPQSPAISRNHPQVDLNFARGEMVILGTQYAGEMIRASPDLS